MSIFRQLTFVVAALAFAVSPAMAQGGPPARPGGVAEPIAKRVTQWDEYSGRFEPVAAVEVRARVSGFIEKLHFRDGQLVNVGDLLFTIDKRPYEIAVEVAELQARENAIRAREQAELANAARDSTFAAMLPAYRMRVKAQIADLKAQMSAKEKLLEEIRQRLSEAYIEKSKFEQLLDQAEIRTATDRATREQAQLDEVAINRAGR